MNNICENYNNIIRLLKFKEQFYSGKAKFQQSTF